MAEYTHLIGAEEVSRAGHSMQDAASSMQGAADSITFALEAHQRFMDDWLSRLEGALAKGSEQ